MKEKMCACGRPLHYINDAARRFVEDMIEQTGDEYVLVTLPSGQYRVQRHFIALHGLAAGDLQRLASEGVVEEM